MAAITRTRLRACKITGFARISSKFKRSFVMLERKFLSVFISCVGEEKKNLLQILDPFQIEMNLQNDKSIIVKIKW